MSPTRLPFACLLLACKDGWNSWCRSRSGLLGRYSAALFVLWHFLSWLLRPFLIFENLHCLKWLVSSMAWMKDMKGQTRSKKAIRRLQRVRIPFPASYPCLSHLTRLLSILRGGLDCAWCFSCSHFSCSNFTGSDRESPIYRQSLFSCS